MPELPEVEAVCRRLAAEATGVIIRRTRMLRYRDRRLEGATRGQRIQRIERRGKNILLHLDGERTVRVHLRMTGNLYVLADPGERPATTSAYFLLEDTRAIVFDDPRALGKMELLNPDQLRRLKASLGPEPLSREFTAAVFAASARQSSTPIKPFLMNQRRVAGLGNIYAAEALHRAGIHPARPANRVSRARLERLHAAIVQVLRDAVESACSAYTGPGRYHSEENFPVAVYGRAGLACPVCGRLVRRRQQAGRTTYYCPGCQH